MFRSKALLAGILLALVATNSPGFFGQHDAQQVMATGATDEAPGEILGYYELDGGKTIVPIREEKGVAERMPAGANREEWFNQHRMTPEAEAALVHRVPPVPFVLDGVQYEPEQIHLFDGRQLGFKTGDDGRLYAFTSFAALNNFLENQSYASLDGPGPEYSGFYSDTYFQGTSWVYVPPNTSLFTLSYLDDMISSEQISYYATYGATLFEYQNLQGDYYSVNGGEARENLGLYGWNDRASSLVVWP
jgi:hypothetical protein